MAGPSKEIEDAATLTGATIRSKAAVIKAGGIGRIAYDIKITLKSGAIYEEAGEICSPDYTPPFMPGTQGEPDPPMRGMFGRKRS